MTAIGRRYGKALLELAAEQGQTEKVDRELGELKKSWDDSEDLREIFQNPSVSQADRGKVVNALATKMGLSVLVKNTVKLLSDRNRTRHLPEVIEAYEKLSQEKAGRVRAEVITATPMPEAYFTQLQRTLERVTGKKVTLDKREDPSIIGGVVARVGDKVFDGSIRTRLDELKDELLER